MPRRRPYGAGQAFQDSDSIGRAELLNIDGAVFGWARAGQIEEPPSVGKKLRPAVAFLSGRAVQGSDGRGTPAGSGHLQQRAPSVWSEDDDSFPAPRSAVTG